MRWRLYIKSVFVVLYTVVSLITLPFLVMELFKKSAPPIVTAWFVSGVFVMGAIFISMWTIIEHLVHYTKPYLQRHIIRILWMVPIYALDAWLALKFQSFAIYFDTLRECYEAYVIYNFLAFLLNFLRHEYPDLGYVLEQKEQVKHIPPLCCCKPWQMGRPFIDHCRHGTLQYTVVRPITTVIALICEMAGVYEEGSFSFKHAYVYLLIINNVSQVWALYCLIQFYQCCKRELKPMKPVSKFLCVKFVVFMSFWQAILIAILAATGVIRKVEAWQLNDVRSIGNSLQNFAICIEMFVAAIAHHFSFSPTPYMNPEAPSVDCCSSWWSMWDVSDMRRDLVEHVRHVGHSVRHIRIHQPTFQNNDHRRYHRLGGSPAHIDDLDPHLDSDLVHNSTKHMESKPLLLDSNSDTGDNNYLVRPNFDQSSNHSSPSSGSPEFVRAELA